MENTNTKSFAGRIIKVLKGLDSKTERSNYSLLSKYDVAPTQYCYNWVYVKSFKDGFVGIATKGKFGTVDLFLYKEGSTTGEGQDITVSKKNFNTEYVITSITDHWGEKIA